MKNVKAAFSKEGVLTLSIDTAASTWKSKSEKTDVIASSEGTQQIILPDGRILHLSLNGYFKPNASAPMTLELG